MSRGDALDRLRQALEDHGCQVHGDSAQCPAHEDTRPSLSVSQGKTGAVLHCHAGCGTDAVLETLGMSAADLFDEPRSSSPSEPEVIATYAYTDERGTPLFYVERRPGKRFRQYHVAGDGSKVWNLNGVRRVPYRLPELLGVARSGGGAVYVCEGEKDVHAIEAAGGVATCNPGGAGKWRAEYAGHFADIAKVIVVADRDEPGRKHGAQVAASLREVVAGVEVVEAATGKDAADHLAAGLGLGDFRPVVAQAASPEPAASRADELYAALLDSAGLDKLPPAQPLIDGLLYRDTLAWLHGKPGHGKSVLALDWACCVSLGLPWRNLEVIAGPVLYVIAEGSAGLLPRVRAWEDNAAETAAVRFLPVAVQLNRPGDFAALAEVAARLSAVLVVIDTQARVTVGADENSAVDMGRLVAAADQVRRDSGACVLFLHHEPRAGDSMRGHTALEGAAATILRVVKDGPRVELTNPKQKDAAEADPIQNWVVPHLQSVIIAAQPKFPSPNWVNPAETTILAVLRDSFGTTGASATVLLDATALPRTTFYRALNRLLRDGRIQNLGSRARSCYVLAQNPLPPVVPPSPT